MRTYDLLAEWAQKFDKCTSKNKKLKPDLISLVVEKKFDNSS